jgi:hypothetical protein
MLNMTNITPPRVPLVDPATGVITREWYRFFLNLFVLTGSGENTASLTDIQLGPQGSEEVFNEINKVNTEASLANTPAQIGTIASLNQDNVNYLGFQTTPALGYTPPVGTVFWDGGTTLTVQNTPNVAQPVGEAQYYYVKATANITKGQLVMFDGSVGASGQLKGKPATGVTSGEYLMGVAAENIALNAFGIVTSFGLVRGFNTSGGAEAWTDGTILYYNPAVAGGLTKTIPSAPNVKAIVAAVVNASSGGAGSVFVRVSFGSKLGETDSNVQFGTLSNNDIIAYDSGAGYWKNVAASDVPGVSSFGTPIGYVAGKYYFPTYDAFSAATGTVSANVLYGCPIYISSAHTFISIGLANVTAAVAGNARLGIYTKKAGADYPDALVLDAGTVSTGATGTKTITISQSLPTGYYFLAVVFDATPTIRGFVAVNGNIIMGGICGTTSADPTAATNGIGHVTGSLTYGALPATFPSATYVGTNGPKIFLGT